MGIGPRPGGPGARRRWAAWPLQLRMTAAYWGLFLVSGVVLLAVTAALWQGETVRTAHVAAGRAGRAAVRHSSDLPQLLLVAGLALVLVAVVSVVSGWLVAGHFLRPVRAITAAARRISATSLHERLGLEGPDDELKELADTFDGLLERLEQSFQFQRGFAASAAHELRTPLATMRVWLDVAAAKPGPGATQVGALAGRMRAELDRMDRLLESLLTLAHTGQGPSADETTLSLAGLACAAVSRRAAAASRLALDICQDPDPRACVRGSETLLSRMVENVVDNAVTHNEPGGWIRVSTSVEGALTRLVVDNGGPVLVQDEVTQLARPFRRLAGPRTGSDRGTGLGLSIVASIAQAHGGTLGLSARGGGGLQVTVTLPAARAGGGP